MSVFSHPEYDGHEKLVFHHDKSTGLKVIVAIHNTNLGHALGGCRMWNYASDDEAIADVLRLSKGMTYKAAITGLNIGGGKSVIIGDPHKDKTPELLRAMGHFMNTLHGEYITAEDVGLNEEDISIIAGETDYVTGYDRHHIGVDGPSPYTAYGVFRGIESAVKFKLGRNNLQGIRVAIQGMGKVGFGLAQLLIKNGATVYGADIFAENIDRAVRELGVIPVSPDIILQQHVDVLSPCAMGATLNKESIPQLNTPIVAGSANNQLGELADGRRLTEAGILYVPDYVINSGGLIKVYYQYYGADRAEVISHIDQIADETLPRIFSVAREQRKPTSVIADELARERFMSGELEQTDAA